MAETNEAGDVALSYVRGTTLFLSLTPVGFFAIFAAALV